MAADSSTNQTKHTTKWKRFGFGGLCLLVGIFMFAVQMFYSMIGSPRSWIGATAWLSVSAILVIIGIWFWDRSANSHWIMRSIASVAALALPLAIGYSPIRRQYIAEHSPSAAPTPPPKTIASESAGTQAAPLTEPEKKGGGRENRQPVYKVTNPDGSIINQGSQNSGTQIVNNYRGAPPPKLIVPKLVMMTREGLTISDFPDLTISPEMTKTLRRQSLTVENPNQNEIQNFVVRFQLPEPVVGNIVVESRPAGVEITWNACRMSMTAIGSGSSVTPLRSGGLEFSTAPKVGSVAGFVGGPEICSEDMNNKRLPVTGTYQLQIQRVPALATIKLGFLTSNAPDNSYMQIATNGPRFSYFGSGTYQFVADGRAETFPVCARLSFDSASRVIYSLPTSGESCKGLILTTN